MIEVIIGVSHVVGLHIEEYVNDLLMLAPRIITPLPPIVLASVPPAALARLARRRLALLFAFKRIAHLEVLLGGILCSLRVYLSFNSEMVGRLEKIFGGALPDKITLSRRQYGGVFGLLVKQRHLCQLLTQDLILCFVHWHLGLLQLLFLMSLALLGLVH